MKVQEAMSAAQQFCEQHLAECCSELLEMHNKGVLPAGRTRELITMCAFAGASAQSVAESMVKLAAMQRVADDSEKQVSYSQVAKWLGFTAPAVRDAFVQEFKDDSGSKSHDS